MKVLDLLFALVLAGAPSDPVKWCSPREEQLARALAAQKTVTATRTAAFEGRIAELERTNQGLREQLAKTDEVHNHITCPPIPACPPAPECSCGADWLPVVGAGAVGVVVGLALPKSCAETVVVR